MAAEERRLAGGFGILVQRRHARHAPPVLGLLGVVFLRNAISGTFVSSLARFS